MATLATNVSFQCLGLDGKPLAGGKVYTYEAGTTTPKSTYTTMAGDVPNLNPVILDQNGKAKIFLGDGAYRVRILDSNDALIDDINQISRYVTQSEFASFQQTVQDGVDQLTEVREQIDVFVSTSIGNQKGFANGIAPLDANVKVDPIYLPSLPNTAIPQSTETALGVAKIATTAIAQAGTNDTDFITALKLKQSFTSLHGDTGWERLPDGLIIQWGLAAVGATTPFPIAFPTACYRVAVSYSSASGTGITFASQSITATRTGVTTYNVGGVPSSYIAIGK